MKNNCFTILSWCLPDINQPQGYTCLLPLKPPSHLPSHPTPLGCHRAPVWVPWAIITTFNNDQYYWCPNLFFFFFVLIFSQQDLWWRLWVTCDNWADLGSNLENGNRQQAHGLTRHCHPGLTCRRTACSCFRFMSLMCQATLCIVSMASSTTS